MGESLHLGRFRGISVGVNWSLVPVFVLVAWSLATTLLPSAAPGHAGWGYWLFALLTAAAFYASLLAHELGHALLARRHGVGVRGIVLWVFGGVAQLEGDTPSPRAELELAAAGPAVSLALAAAGLGAAAALAALRADSLLVAAVGWLGAINALLAVFNLLPAFPLDGGRILRSLLWWRWGDRERATAAAARVGRAGGFVLIALGAVEFLVGGGALGGLWLALIGWFVVSAAAQQRDRYMGGGRAERPRAGEAMNANPTSIPAGLTVAQALEAHVRPTRFAAFPVIDAERRVLGLVTVERIAALPRESWATTPILAAAVPDRELVRCAAGDRLEEVAARMRAADARLALVLENGRLVGILSASDILRATGDQDPLAWAWRGGPATSGWSRSPGHGWANSYGAPTGF